MPCCTSEPGSRTPAVPIQLPLDGADNRVGFEVVRIGVSANVCGVWHRDDSARIIFLSLQEGPHKPAVKDLKNIAKIVVPHFW